MRKIFYVVLQRQIVDTRQAAGECRPGGSLLTHEVDFISKRFHPRLLGFHPSLTDFIAFAFCLRALPHRFAEPPPGGSLKLHLAVTSFAKHIIAKHIIAKHINKCRCKLQCNTSSTVKDGPPVSLRLGHVLALALLMQFTSKTPLRYPLGKANTKKRRPCGRRFLFLM